MLCPESTLYFLVSSWAEDLTEEERDKFIRPLIPFSDKVVQESLLESFLKKELSVKCPLEEPTSSLEKIYSFRLLYESGIASIFRCNDNLNIRYRKSFYKLMDHHSVVLVRSQTDSSKSINEIKERFYMFLKRTRFFELV